MALFDTVKTYEFKGQKFASEASGRWAVWFKRDAIVSEDPILDSEESFFDVGGTSWQPLTKTAVFATAAERDDFCNLVKQRGTLKNIQGRTVQAYLQSVEEQNSGDGLFFAEITFRRVF